MLIIGCEGETNGGGIQCRRAAGDDRGGGADGGVDDAEDEGDQ